MPKRILKGKVSSDKAEKTISVLVVRKKKHPTYKKVMAYSKKFLAHDEENQAKEGDTVIIEESRPFSKRKTWILKSIVEKAV